MNRWRAGLTRADVLVIVAIIVVVGLLVGVLLPMLAQPRERAWNAHCRSNLCGISMALAAYHDDNNSYYPFSWGPAGSAPNAFNNAAASSLGTLYPRYLQTARAFRCPSTENEPAFVPHGEGSNTVWVLTGSSYGFDPRVSRTADGKVVIMADMDGNFSMSQDTATRNHSGGQNVLYADGHVKWIEDNYASDDSKNNIFAQDPWDADTDTYLVRGDLNNLTVSFDGYDHLK